MTKGFWLSIDLLHDKNTTMQEKLLLIEINQLSMLDKGCIASNNHFAETFKVKKESISRSLSSLEQKGYITTEIKAGSRNHDRTITINKMLFYYEQNVIAPLTNCLETKENKTINKTKNISIDIVSSFFDENRDIKKDDKSIKIMSDFVTYRKQIKKPIKTTGNLKLYYNKLKELHLDGYDISKCIEEMKLREWQIVDKKFVKDRDDLKVSKSNDGIYGGHSAY